MDKIPTAEEKLIANFYNGSFIEINNGDVEQLKEIMIEFAKLHCKAQLKAILEKVQLTEFAYEFLQEGANDAINKDSILNAYPLGNIK